MNAEEAIEIVEQQRDDLSELIHKIEADYSKSRLRESREEVEALSIVLESAKYLHKELINEELTRHLENTKILYLNTEYAENKVIANSKAKMIGLEGANE